MSTNSASSPNSFEVIEDYHHSDYEKYVEESKFNEILGRITNGTIDSWEKANDLLHSIFGFRHDRIFANTLNPSLNIIDSDEVQQVIEVSLYNCIDYLDPPNLLTLFHVVP